MPDAADSPIRPKQEHSREASLESLDSSSEPDAEGEIEGHISPPTSVQVQKRKGGRKPIYATSEERKQRNRQAQAAFRERRTEYIKQLEATIKEQDGTLQNLQQSHRSAADECLMLRYKNSLLERILLEKGIDVQTELKKKEIPPTTRMPASLPQPTPIQRVSGHRQHHVRMGSGSSSSTLHKSGKLPNHSPQLQPTSSPHTSSPIVARSPMFGVQGGMNPPQAGFQAQPQPQQHQLQSQPNASTYPSSVSIPAPPAVLQSIVPNPSGIIGKQRPSHWPSPYQTHIEQLEQEYDAHADMLDEDVPLDPNEDAHIVSGPFPAHFGRRPQQHDMAQCGQPPMMHPGEMQQVDQNAQGDFVGQGQAFDPYDPMLDADPFGLTASMHFPTPFSFQESAMRR